MAPSEFDSAVQEFAESNSSIDPQIATPFTPIYTYLRSKTYAKVPISVKPGSGANMVHQSLGDPPMEAADLLCSATARLLDLQTLLEMPLAVLGIRLQRQHGVVHPELGDLKQTYLWPDMAKVAAIEVVRIRREPTEGSTVASTERKVSSPLTPADFAQKVWDFVQPEQNVYVVIHIRTVPGKPPPSIPARLQSRIENDRPRGQKRKEPVTCTPPPRDPAFRNNVKPGCCVVTGNSSVLQAAHIISRSLRHQLVIEVLELLFGMDSCPATATAKPALFAFRSDQAMYDKEDDPRNGMLLSPSLHTAYDFRRTIWILRQQCYVIGTPLCCEEFNAFDPPDPSVIRVRKIRSDAEDRALWEEQLLHEQQVKPLQCAASLLPTQECLLHLSALLSFFWLFMKKQKAIQDILAKLEIETIEGRSSHSDDQSGPRKKQKQKMSNTDGKQAPHEGTGPRASGGTDGGSTKSLPDQQEPKRSNRGWFSRNPRASPPAPNPPSHEGSPSSKQGRIEDSVAAPKAPSTLTPANSDDENKVGSDSDLDPNSSCEEESDWDEDENRRRELLHSDNLALLLMKHTLTSGVGQLYV
ncbi:hypothetical protein OC846_001438 [Tilletia horrida]|uniref:HNH nuclease domain-containing protein n=1 Tax=Tilletia horrida TaxID=155126 RepID=A0AAN6JSZ7_9BASI|nr:hypothetical protein OC845_002513 [Tilletia horrida]KAK0556002.1 hypothetical protein OC846_001438 [Tilletia horrida]KAK0569035.1 hypothetical protein OC861_001376 [Tilletia horrida]